MRCYTVGGTGLDSLKLAERPAPAGPGVGEALVAVRAVSLNFRDLLVAQGRYGGVNDPPIVAASDMAGEVLAVGDGVSTLAPGDRVLNAPFRKWPCGTLRREWSRTFVGGQGVDGVLAEQIVYPAEALVKLPPQLSFEQGATLPVAGLTAWAAIATFGRLLPGQWVLAHGTGGVSIFAAQLAGLFQGRVIMSSSIPEKARVVKERFGVAETIDYRDDSWVEAARRITGGRGVDLVVETAGGSMLEKSIEVCGYGGKVAVIGVLSGLQASLNVFHLLMHQVTLRGIYMESTAELGAFVRAVDAGCLEPCIDRVFEFGDAPAAYDYLLSGHHIGKVVIRI